MLIARIEKPRVCPVQLSLLEPVEADNSRLRDDDLGLTFRGSKTLPVHRWYPYVEGFAADYISSLVRSLPSAHSRIYDPFGGSGTVCVIASSHGHGSAFSELNPYMRYVAETKVNAALWARQHPEVAQDCFTEFLDRLLSARFARRAAKVDLADYNRAFPGRDFFEEQHIRELIAAKDVANDVAQGRIHLGALLALAVSSVLVHNSNMTRRADLRRRKPGEYKNRSVDVPLSIKEKLDEIQHDLQFVKRNSVRTSFVNDDAKEFISAYAGTFDKIITSPPYLNGTNYFRNTKIELWFLGFIRDETELSKFNDRCVCGGINNISGRREVVRSYRSVEAVANQLDLTDGDRRIGAMVRQYFNDISQVLENCCRYLKPGALLHIDIGDSKFYGVHVPTDKLLIDVAEATGLRLVETKVLARRHSRDKTPLTQVELTFASEGVTINAA